MASMQCAWRPRCPSSGCSPAGAGPSSTAAGLSRSRGLLRQRSLQVHAASSKDVPPADPSGGAAGSNGRLSASPVATAEPPPTAATAAAWKATPPASIHPAQLPPVELEHRRALCDSGLPDVDECILSEPSDEQTPVEEAFSRGKWLLGLLVAQSTSSVVLHNYEDLLREHLVVTLFLTMLVGAGGNAGNQSAIKVIRALATGSIDVSWKSFSSMMADQATVALLLGGALSVGGYVRVYATNGDTTNAAAISLSLLMIVMSSVVLGTGLPFALARMGIDPANAGTSIQVVMAIFQALQNHVLAFVDKYKDDPSAPDYGVRCVRSRHRSGRQVDGKKIKIIITPASSRRGLSTKNGFPLLALCADRPLSMHATSAASERNWSVWGHIFTKNRTRLGLIKGEMLVFIRGNSETGIITDGDEFEEEISLEMLEEILEGDSSMTSRVASRPGVASRRCVVACKAVNANQALAAAALATVVGFGAVEPAMADIAGLTPCASSKAFAKREKTEVKKLESRLKKYEAGSAPALALSATIERTHARFANYGGSGVLCGNDGLPHLIADPGLALRYGHAGEIFIPTIGFLYVAGWIGNVGRAYLQATKSVQKEIIIDVPLALKLAGQGAGWPLTVVRELQNGSLLEDDKNITISPR
ncbi:hypothetical protein FOA52_000790 [Chlamydomonas sp. UWO 241]|nr:hypothetical protein FOA52_000790 [Chlamydomonas sp. UWO 241]